MLKKSSKTLKKLQKTPKKLESRKLKQYTQNFGRKSKSYWSKQNQPLYDGGRGKTPKKLNDWKKKNNCSFLWACRCAAPKNVMLVLTENFATSFTFQHQTDFKHLLLLKYFYRVRWSVTFEAQPYIYVLFLQAFLLPLHCHIGFTNVQHCNEVWKIIVLWVEARRQLVGRLNYWYDNKILIQAKSRAESIFELSAPMFSQAE